MSFIMMLLPTYNNNGMVNHCLSTGHYLPYSSPKNRGLVFGGGWRGLFIDYPPVTKELNAFEYIPIQFIEHFPVGWYLGGSSSFLSSYCIGVSNYMYASIITMTIYLLPLTSFTTSTLPPSMSCSSSFLVFL